MHRTLPWQEKPTIHRNLIGPVIQKSEVREALAKLKNNKTITWDETATDADSLKIAKLTGYKPNIFAVKYWKTTLHSVVKEIRFDQM